jgi:hypothetical protein
LKEKKVGVYYLSDGSYGWLRKEARKGNVSVGRLIDGKVEEWTARRVVLPPDVVEVIEGRREEVRRRESRSALERDDRRRRTVGAEGLYDGVVYRIVFGWERKPHEIGVGNVVEVAEVLLGDWIVREGVVRRRAASRRTLAGCALELIGRGWIDGTR